MRACLLGAASFRVFEDMFLACSCRSKAGLHSLVCVVVKFYTTTTTTTTTTKTTTSWRQTISGFSLSLAFLSNITFFFRITPLQVFVLLCYTSLCANSAYINFDRNVILPRLLARVKSANYRINGEQEI